MKEYKIILASNSPRRKELLAGLDIDFEVKVLPGIDESYPEKLPVDEIVPPMANKTTLFMPHLNVLFSSIIISIKIISWIFVSCKRPQSYHGYNYA